MTKQWQGGADCGQKASLGYFLFKRTPGGVDNMWYHQGGATFHTVGSLNHANLAKV